MSIMILSNHSHGCPKGALFPQKGNRAFWYRKLVLISVSIKLFNQLKSVLKKSFTDSPWFTSHFNNCSELQWPWKGWFTTHQTLLAIVKCHTHSMVT